MPLDSFAALRDELDRRIELLRSQICGGVPLDKYTEMIGRLRGLQEARNLTVPPKEDKKLDPSAQSKARYRPT